MLFPFAIRWDIVIRAQKAEQYLKNGNPVPARGNSGVQKDRPKYSVGFCTTRRL